MTGTTPTAKAFIGKMTTTPVTITITIITITIITITATTTTRTFPRTSPFA